MKVQELIDEIESSRDKYPTWVQYVIEWWFIEWYYLDDEGQYWQIRKVDDIWLSTLKD